MAAIKIGVIGLGFIGTAHIEALKRLGSVVIDSFVESNPESAKRNSAALGIEKYYADYQDLLKDPSVNAVHVCTPNFLHFQMAKDALNAGKHVVCEKPLATTVAEARELVDLAAKKGLCNAVNFNIRYYPLMRELKQRIAHGDLGNLFSVHGSYLQDWLFYNTDYNWRLETSQAGNSRAVADIGSHWMDLVEQVTGVRFTEVIADFATFHPVRKKPAKPVETFSGKLLKPEDYIDIPISTEDYATIMFRCENGARAVLTVSQVAAGRKNRIFFEVDGSRKSAAWNSERPNELWLGNRDSANELLMKDPSLVSPEARSIISFPGGHNEGFPDTLKQFYREFYTDVAKGKPAEKPYYATFKDGLRELELCEKIIESNKARAWVKI